MYYLNFKHRINNTNYTENDQNRRSSKYEVISIINIKNQPWNFFKIQDRINFNQYRNQKQNKS